MDTMSADATDADATSAGATAEAAVSEPGAEAAADPIDDREWEIEETVITGPHVEARNGAPHDE